jgi:hypothetical protein
MRVYKGIPAIPRISGLQKHALHGTYVATPEAVL